MLALRSFVYVVLALILLPILVIVPVAFSSAAIIAFPPPHLSLRWFQAIFADQGLIWTTVRALQVAALSSLASVAIGLPSCFALHRGTMPFKETIQAFITSPRMVPQIVIAVVFLIYFEKIGIAETFAGLVIAHTVVGIPFAFRVLFVTVTTLDRRLEWSSDVLGASPVQTFANVVVPQIKTGVIAAFIFTFILSFNNVTLALFLAGPGNRTLSLEMFSRMHVTGMTPVIPAIAILLVLVGLLTFIVLDRWIGVFKYLIGR